MDTVEIDRIVRNVNRLELGSFLRSVVDAWTYATESNKQILKPAMETFIEKYTTVFKR